MSYPVLGEKMPKPAIDKGHLKELVKAAIVEVLDERRDLFRDLIAEAIEDIAMARAIKEGASTKIVDSSEIYKILDRKE